ncbi:MAG TPA: flagellar basal body L-ring protein FlgH [Bryobacterales bacterium]|nr:flagellar basal body L-ring protein FlgH [Bryobacterales bacterium]
MTWRGWSGWAAVAAGFAMVVSMSMAASEQGPSPLDRYIEEAQRAGGSGTAASGSLYAPQGLLANLFRDPRALRVNDIVTVVVSEQASALAKGTTSNARKTSATVGVSALHGLASPKLSNLAGSAGNTSLDGQGSTTRQSQITTRLSARITHVLPNGYLVVEADKDVVVNAERQLITVRGVVRPVDLAPDNTVSSDRLAQMEIRVNGKGVVNDAIHRPFILYRILMGLLPF